MESAWVRENFLTWIDKWLDNTLSEYVRVETIIEPKTGFAHVGDFNLESERKYPKIPYAFKN